MDSTQANGSRSAAHRKHDTRFESGTPMCVLPCHTPIAHGAGQSRLPPILSRKEMCCADADGKAIIHKKGGCPFSSTFLVLAGRGSRLPCGSPSRRADYKQAV